MALGKDVDMIHNLRPSESQTVRRFSRTMPFLADIANSCARMQHHLMAQPPHSMLMQGMLFMNMTCIESSPWLSSHSLRRVGPAHPPTTHVGVEGGAHTTPQHQ